MATVRVDIIGTTFTRGGLTTRHDTATRQAMLSNEGAGPNIFNNTNSDYQRAVNAYISSEGLYYPTVFEIASDNTNDPKTNIGPQLLPLLKIRAQRYGPDKLLVTARYQRTPGTDEPDDPFLRATFRPVDEDLLVYRHSFRTDISGNVVETDVYFEGLPGGDFISPHGALDATKTPADYHQQWPVSALGVYISLQLSGPPPVGALESFRNTINDGTVRFLGFDFPVGTVYFDGYEVDYVGDNSFSVLLLFKLLAPGWKEQKVVKISTGVPPAFLNWDTVVHFKYPLSNFLNFPL